jgi:predicted metal-binding protein
MGMGPVCYDGREVNRCGEVERHLFAEAGFTGEVTGGSDCTLVRNVQSNVQRSTLNAQRVNAEKDVAREGACFVES